MRQGLVLLAIAIALVLAFGLFLHDLSTVDRWYVESAAEEADEHRREAYNQISENCLSLPAAQARRCTYQARNTYYQQQHEDADLAAQRQMAMWTKWMGIAAFFAILVSIAGVFLVWTTFRETRRANVTASKEFARARLDARKAAKSSEEALRIGTKSAAAAADQVTVAQDTAYRELRAYLSVEEVTIELVTADFIKGKLVVRNAGKTPAQIKVFMTGWIGPHPQPKLYGVGPTPYDYRMHKPFINRGGAESIDWFFPLLPIQGDVDAAADIAKLVADPVHTVVFVYGRIEFFDFLQRERILHFAFRNHGAIKIGEGCEMYPLPFGNHYEERAKQVREG